MKSGRKLKKKITRKSEEIYFSCLPEGESGYAPEPQLKEKNKETNKQANKEKQKQN